MKLIDTKLLDTVTHQAKQSNRLRMNYNFHEHMDDKAQKLLNALEPGTLLPVHRHQHTAETYVLLRGKLKILFYDADRLLVETTILSHSDGVFGVEIPAGQWHTVEVLESGTVIFEVKEGPYAPLNEEDIMIV